MKNSEGYLVATSIDDRYLWPWLVMVYSAVLNRDNVKFRLILANINNKLSKENVLVAKEFCELLSLELEIVEIFTSIKPKFRHNFNLTVYSRLFLMDKLEQDFLWLDADLLLNSGWTRIFFEKGDLGGSNCVLNAVPDTVHTRERLKKTLNGAYKVQGDRYFNSGVLKIYVSEWKAVTNKANWLEMSENLEKYDFELPDQDILNYITKGKVSILDGGFNYIVGDDKSETESIYIYHFAGSPKPWNLDQNGKEFYLLNQSINYFRSESSLSQNPDSFLYFSRYWRMEDSLILFLEKKNFRYLENVLNNRFENLRKLDRVSNLKLSLLKVIVKKYRS